MAATRSDRMRATTDSEHSRFELDPVVVGHRECEAWAAYYRRDWPRFLISATGMVQAAFGMRRDLTVRGAWHVLRANQFWAGDDPAAARRSMGQFYSLVAHWDRMSIDPAVAAGLEVEWWRVHRLHRAGANASTADIVDSLTALYDYLYAADRAATRRAAEYRVTAMDFSDRWVAAGRRRCDPLLIRERRALVESYTELGTVTGAR